MATQHDTTETVSETLEYAFAHSVDRIQECIDAALGLADGSPEQLAEIVKMARDLEARVERLWFESEDAERQRSGADEPKAGGRFRRPPEDAFSAASRKRRA